MSAPWPRDRARLRPDLAACFAIRSAPTQSAARVEAPLHGVLAELARKGCR